MNRTQLELGLRRLRFLDAHADLPEALLEIRPGRVLVWDHEAIEAIFRADQRLRHPGSNSFKPLLGPKSMLWQDGPRHAAYRRVLGPHLRGREIDKYRKVIAETADTMISGLTTGTEFAIAGWTRTLALRIMARIVFGRVDEDLLASYARWMNRALGSRPRTLSYRYLRGGLPRPDRAMEEQLVASARKSARDDETTLAGRLLASDGPLGALDDSELRDQLVSLLFAGHETTASTAAWTVYWIDRNEAVRNAVLAELAATSDDGYGIDNCPTLHAAVSETLRLTPAVPAAGNRVLTEPWDFRDSHFDGGTVLMPSIYLAHRRADRFPEPTRFDPHRFLGRRVPSPHYFPFGGGTRHCLGSQLGQLEVRMIVAGLLRRRELRCVDPRSGVPQLRGHTMAPSPKLMMKVLSCLD